jgi:ABC-type dipeptide/oligopeptide/nickel transport system ATPase component
MSAIAAATVDPVAARHTDELLLEVRSLRGRFTSSHTTVPALHDVTFGVRRGSITAMVGETGSGKTLTALSILRITPPAFALTGGRIEFAGIDLLGLDERQLTQVRGRRISMVFQDARTALNPVLTIGRQIADVCRRHGGMTRRDAATEAVRLLERVRINDPDQRARQYPHELSGGMAQRAMIAMALAPRPELVLLDEPTSGLDVTTQAEILALLTELVADDGLTALLITHDLGVVAEVCDDVVVLRDGRVVETATVRDLFTRPSHRYSATLIEAGQLGVRPAR